MIVDAGVGTASDVTIAMELGVDGVLLNTGIAHAKDPLRMADAMRHATEAGRLAYLAGRIPKRLYATASSPEEGVITAEAAVVDSIALLRRRVHLLRCTTWTLTAADILGPEGRIAARLANYEHRPQQLEMADAVARAIAAKRHLVAEAGTGVGKSFAYLVPAILAATEAKHSSRVRRDWNHGQTRPPHAAPKIVVSTHTISLQEQLIGKDLPLLNAVIPREFSAVLVKGRRNYSACGGSIWRSPAARACSTTTSSSSSSARFASGAKSTADGSLSDLAFQPLGQVWDEVASDSGNCMGRRCPTYNQCFYYKDRRRAQHAQILVVNHALLFSDIALRRAGVSILPDYDVVILDEAHTVEAVASDHLGINVTSGQIEYMLNKLYNDRTNKGLLVHHGLTKEQQQVDRCRHLADEFFADLCDWRNQSSDADGQRRLGRARAAQLGSHRRPIRVHEPNIVANHLSPELEVLAHASQSGRQETQRGIRAAGFHRRPRPADRTRRRAGNVAHAGADGHRLLDRIVPKPPRHAALTLAAAPIDIGPRCASNCSTKCRPSS